MGRQASVLRYHLPLMKFSRSLIVLPILVALAGCGGSSGSSSSTPPPTSNAGPSCEGVRLGQVGVIALKCDGTATVKATTGGVSSTITGGVCTTGAGLFVVNAGVVTDHTFVGTRPDFLSVNTPTGGGGGPDTAASILIGGK